jgi:4-hydroxybenzoate polyprenyltransferase
MGIGDKFSLRFQYLIFFRVFDWVHILGLAILGYVYASGNEIVLNSSILIVFISALYLAHGYSLNECFDNKCMSEVKIRDGQYIPFKKAILLSYIVLVMNIIFSFIYSLQITLLVIFGGLVAFLYSASPVRLKKIPFMGLFCNSLCFVPLFLIGYAIDRDLDLAAFLMAVFIFILFLPIDLVHQLNDFQEDEPQNLRTTAKVLGVKKTIILIGVSLIALSGWTLFLYKVKKISYFPFILTLFFSIVIIIYLLKKIIKYGTDIGKYKIKLNMRYLFIVYGLGLFTTFYFHN